MTSLRKSKEDSELFFYKKKKRHLATLARAFPDFPSQEDWLGWVGVANRFSWAEVPLAASPFLANELTSQELH